MNGDTLFHVLSHLPMHEKLKCRLVCRAWLGTVDKLFAGQNSLEIVVRTHRDQFCSSNCCVIVNRNSLDFAAFHFILTRFRNITSLTIRNLTHLSDIIIFAISKSCPKICDIKLCSCSGPLSSEVNEFSFFNHLSGYGWQLLTCAYPNLSKLTLRHCHLHDDEVEKIVRGCLRIKYLDISDNPVTGSALTHVPATLETLIVGDLSTELSIESHLGNIVSGNGRFVKKLHLFGGLSNLQSLRKMTNLESLHLHYFSHEEEPSNVFNVIGCLKVKELVLEQIRCHDLLSAIDDNQFVAMIRGGALRKLAILGEYGWILRLSDYAIHELCCKCQRLRHLTLNGNGAISDSSLAALSNLCLESLNLTSFDKVSDVGFQKFLTRCSTLRSVTIGDNSAITEAVMRHCVSLCQADSKRFMRLTLTGIKVVKPPVLPDNLKVRIENVTVTRSSEEPSKVQLLIVMAMSAMILIMALLTTIAVVLVPLGMLLMMLHEYLFQNLWFVTSDPKGQRAALELMFTYANWMKEFL